jgi:hypothetical protein
VQINLVSRVCHQTLGTTWVPVSTFAEAVTCRKSLDPVNCLVHPKLCIPLSQYSRQGKAEVLCGGAASRVTKYPRLRPGRSGRVLRLEIQESDRYSDLVGRYMRRRAPDHFITHTFKVSAPPTIPLRPCIPGYCALSWNTFKVFGSIYLSTYLPIYYRSFIYEFACCLHRTSSVCGASIVK